MSTPRIYVGTYGKYNSSSIAGRWLDLEDYPDKDSFYEACAALHSDEEDPEFMFQDYEGFPDAYYSESGLPDELWDWLELDEDDREILAAFQACFGEQDATIDTARDAYYGKFDSDVEFAEELVESCGMLHDVPENIKCYFDMEKYARDLMVDFTEHEGHYFNRNW